MPAPWPNVWFECSSLETVAAPSRPRMITSRRPPLFFFFGELTGKALAAPSAEGGEITNADRRRTHKRDTSCARKQECMHNATPSSPLERDATEAPPQAILNATTKSATTNNCYYRERHTYTDTRTRHAISRGNRRYSTSYLPRNHARPRARTYTTRNDTQT